MTQAFVTLAADRIEPGPMREVAGALQQETRLYQGRQCVCVLLVTFPEASPEWERWQAAKADGEPA